MGKSTKALFVLTVLAVTFAVLSGALFTIEQQPLRAAEAEEADPAPPADQEYTGAKRCASCHFTQFMAWNKSKHSKTFNLLPAEYQTDAKCLPCHTTGYGEPTGYKDMATTPSLAGNTCETCHGPGSKHEEVAQSFGKEKLNEEQEKVVRDSIWLMLPKNVCVECHKVQGHGEPETPKELRTK